MLRHLSPIGTSQYEFFVNASGPGTVSRRELDPAGAIIPLFPQNFGDRDRDGDLPSVFGGSGEGAFGSISSPGAGCTLDGVYVPCSMAYRFLESGAARVCPNNDCSPRRVDIDIRYQNGATRHESGWVLNPFALPDGTFTFYGAAAAAADMAFRYQDGGFELQARAGFAAGLRTALMNQIDGGASLFQAHFTQDPVPVPGPDPTKKPRGGMDDDQWKNFKKAYDIALAALNDSECLRAVSELGGVLDRDGPKGAKAVLQGLLQMNNFVYVPVIKGAIAQASETGRGINTQIRLTDRFYSGELGASNLNMDNLLYHNTLALIILHELVHALGGQHKGPDDGIDESKKWDDRLFTDCFHSQG